MRRWMLVTCLICLSGALFGTVKLQNQLMKLEHSPPRRIAPAAEAEEYVVYNAVLESSLFTPVPQEHSTSVIMDRTMRSHRPAATPHLEYLAHFELCLDEIPDEEYPAAVFAGFALPPDAVTDFVLKNAQSSPLESSSRTPLPFPLASEAALNAREQVPMGNWLAFSRVGFAGGMQQAVLYVVQYHHAGLDSWMRGYYVHLVKDGSRWVIKHSHLAAAMSA